MAGVGVLDASSGQIYKYLNFDQITEYADKAKTVTA
jgi:aconitate hydratase 2/2-methylisocitrate dehydratase